MPSTTSTLAVASVPKRACRPENSRAISRHWLSTYKSVHTRPPIASARYHCHSGRSCEMATAASTSATPSQPRSPRALFNIRVYGKKLTAPAFRIDRLGRQKQSERDETQVVHDVLRVDDAACEVVQVLGDREKREDCFRGRSRALAEPVDHPEQQEDRKRHDRGDDL